MKRTRNRGWGFVILMFIAALASWYFQKDTSTKKPPVSTRNDGSDYLKNRGLNRQPAQIVYSKHAKCRMGCRFIDEQEVRQILAEGSINYQKSELNTPDCQKKYAVEGITKDAQHVRIIFAPCQTDITVVTVIDLDKDWPCQCQ
jgi:hypothetical protein